MLMYRKLNHRGGRHTMALIDQTKQLKKYTDSLKSKFDQGNPPEDLNDRSFFNQMKKETNPIYVLLSKWEENTLSLIKKRKLNLHPQQIFSTRENMELLLLHSYYIDARRKRYMELYNSIQYVFGQIINELSNE